jgi:hypothetical protein
MSQYLNLVVDGEPIPKFPKRWKDGIDAMISTGDPFNLGWSEPMGVEEYDRHLGVYLRHLACNAMTTTAVKKGLARRALLGWGPYRKRQFVVHLSRALIEPSCAENKALPEEYITDLKEMLKRIQATNGS